MRPAGELVRVASGFESSIAILREGISANGKSIISVISLAAESETDITIQADGPDETAALEALANLVERNFGEDG